MKFSLKQFIFRKIREWKLIKKIQSTKNFLANTPLEVTPLKIVEGHRVLVLSPHQDDETFGCGGTLHLLSNSGSSIDVCFLTNGEAGSSKGTEGSESQKSALIQTREREAQNAGSILGVRQYFFLNAKDSQLHLDETMVDKVYEIITTGNYHQVFCPWPYERHSDHAATFQIFQKVLKYYKKEIEIWLYEVWTPLIPNRIVDITQSFPVKKQAIEAYLSQLEDTNYREAFTSLAHYRSIYLSHQQKDCRNYAEAFLCGNKKFILSL